MLWLLDGGLQFQTFMYSHGFIAMMVEARSGQPTWLANSMRSATNIGAGHLAIFNTLFALTQVVIGLGLGRRTAWRTGH